MNSIYTISSCLTLNPSHISGYPVSLCRSSYYNFIISDANIIAAVYLSYIYIFLKRKKEWSEPLRVDKKLSNADSWREVHEEDKAALRPRLQDISISRT